MRHHFMKELSVSLGGAREAIEVAGKVPSTLMLPPETLRDRIKMLELLLRLPLKVRRPPWCIMFTFMVYHVPLVIKCWCCCQCLA